MGSERPLEGEASVTGLMQAGICCLLIEFKFMHFYEVVRA